MKSQKRQVLGPCVTFHDDNSAY